MEKKKSTSTSTSTWNSKKERGESSTDSKNVTLKDAAAYLNTVREAFEEEDSEEKFEEFLNLLKAYKAKKMDRDCLIGKVKELFKCHKDLIIGFNIFFPSSNDSSENAVPPPESSSSGLEEEAHSFLIKIENRFEGTDVFRRFIRLMDKYGKKTKTLTEVYLEVTVLFGNHNDLLQQFGRYIPPETVKAVPPKKRHIRYGDGGSHREED